MAKRLEAESDRESGEECESKVLKLFQDKLGLTRMGASDIEACHRIGKRERQQGTGDFRPSGLPIDLFVSDKLKAQILQGDCIDLAQLLIDTLDRRGTGFMSPEFLKKMADKDASGSDAGGRDAGSEMELTGQSKTILDVMKGLFAEFAQTTDAKIERLSQEVARTKRDRYESDSESESDVSSTECKKRKN
nr:hypothetical protein BaRGS_016582 [Batillaria attramentaria]